MRGRFIFIITLSLLFVPVYLQAQAPIIADNDSVHDFNNIDTFWIEQAKELVQIYYGHTSHGRQITDGITVLEDLDNLYTFHTNSLVIEDSLSYVETAPDAGYYPAWVDDTRYELNQSSNNRNTVMWSWCGQLSWWSAASVQQYLDAMSDLENDYPNTTFIYMTGHLDESGSTSGLWQNNNMIRNHVNDPNAPVRRVLFDFADIERYDPDGRDYLDVNLGDGIFEGAGAIEGDGCRYNDGQENWCTDWCENNSTSDLCAPVASCAHSFTLNCNMKARAFWWMMARIAGWDGGTSSDTTPPSSIDDLTTTFCNHELCSFQWSAPGDDGNTGTASAYDMRYSRSPINAGNFLSANQASGEPQPQALAGATDIMNVTGLNSETTYYFAIRTRDEAYNWSPISNIESNTTDAIPDTTPPGTVNDLHVISCSDNSCSLSWSAPGNDGNTGIANLYDFRYSTSNINESNFSSATQITSEPAPQTAGTSQSITITGLNALTTYYFAMKTRDEAENWSDLSNIASDTTADIPDTIAPTAISDLSVISCTTNSCEISWTSTGDDGNAGTASNYDIRYSTSLITESSFNSAETVEVEPAPLVSGSNQSMTVIGLFHSRTYYFAIKISDEVPNWSDISNIANGDTEVPADTMAPSAISDLTISSCILNSCDLTWTSTGDDGNSGTISGYDIRYSTSIINDTNFNSAQVVSSLPTPLISGSTQNITVTGLNHSTRYYFAIKARDEVPNWSDISNIVYDDTTIPLDTTAPSAISDLSVISCNTDSCDISWSATGDNGSIGTALNYDIRYSASIILDNNDFDLATIVENNIVPQQSGYLESFTIEGLSSSTIYFFAIKATDDSSNISDTSNSVAGITDALTLDDDDDDDDDDIDITPQTEDNDRDPLAVLFSVSGGCGFSQFEQNNKRTRNISLIFILILSSLAIIATRRRTV